MNDIHSLLIVSLAPSVNYFDLPKQLEDLRDMWRLTIPAEPRFGMEHFAADYSNLIRHHYEKEPFIGDEQNRFHFIICDLPGTLPNPSCAERSTFDGLFVEIHYSRDFLPHWRELRDSVDRLIKSFEQP